MLFRKKEDSSKLLKVVFGTALAHIAVLICRRWQIQASNLIQLFAALLVVGTCLLRSRRTGDRYLRSAWLELSAGFTIYAGAQGYFTWSLIWKQVSPPFPSPADFLWLMFAFPILLVTVKRRSGTQRQWADWLDTAQACIFCLAVCSGVFASGGPVGIAGV